MAEQLRLMCIFAHPDDETLGAGGILAKYAAEGIETYLITATRGERGWAGKPEHRPSMAELGRIRESELRCAASVLGIREVIFLETIDGEVDQADPGEIIARIAEHIRRVCPQVVVTMDPQGVYGHPDHIAVGQFALGAIVAAGSALTGASDLQPHLVSKLYLVSETQATIDGFSDTFGSPMGMTVDGEERRASGWPGWAVSAEVDASAYWDTVVRALACHKTQINDLAAFAAMPHKHSPAVWGIRSFYRAYSLVNGGRAKEDDLFAGLRTSDEPEGTSK